MTFETISLGGAHACGFAPAADGVGPSIYFLDYDETARASSSTTRHPSGLGTPDFYEPYRPSVL